MALVLKQTERKEKPATLTGPIRVNGAEPGNVLEVRIKKLVPVDYGVNFIYPGSMGKGGLPEDFPEGLTFLPENKLYIIREGDDFFALSAVCTHLFCVVDWKPDSEEFYCSCHGSIFTKEGVNLTGPAPKPLPWFSLALAPDGNLLVDSSEEVSSDQKFSL